MVIEGRRLPEMGDDTALESTQAFENVVPGLEKITDENGNYKGLRDSFFGYEMDSNSREHPVTY